MKTKVTILVLSMGMALLNFTSNVNAAGAQEVNPTISLFPSTVKQDLKQSVEATKKLEDSIQPIIEQMADTKSLFDAANCDGAAADPGCSQIKKQLQQQYLDMLNEVDAILPEVEKSIRATHQSLSKSITKTLGRTKTPYQLQQEFMNKANSIPDRIRSTKKKGLSSRLEGLLRLTATKSDPSTALVAASEFFLDANDSLAIISQTRSAIAQAITQAGLDLELGSLSEEMYATVEGVKNILDDENYEEINDRDTILPNQEDGAFDDTDIIF